MNTITTEEKKEVATAAANKATTATKPASKAKAKTTAKKHIEAKVSATVSVFFTVSPLPKGAILKAYSAGMASALGIIPVGRAKAKEVDIDLLKSIWGKTACNYHTKNGNLTPPQNGKVKLSPKGQDFFKGRELKREYDSGLAAQFKEFILSGQVGKDITSYCTKGNTIRLERH